MIAHEEAYPGEAFDNDRRRRCEAEIAEAKALIEKWLRFQQKANEEQQEVLDDEWREAKNFSNVLDWLREFA
jgi:hypothetical protein